MDNHDNKDNSEYFSFKAKGVLKNPAIVLSKNYETLDFPPTCKQQVLFIYWL